MRSWKKFKKNPLALLSATFILILVVVALCAPYIAHYSYDTPTGHRLRPPGSFENILGTDFLERDVLSRLVYGAQISMLIGFMVAICALFFGTSYGALAGYVGGRLDNILMRIVDIFYTFPSIVLIILVTVILGRGVMGILLALTLIGWADVSRLVRGQVLQLKEEVYVTAARSIGASHFQIIVKHMLPNMWGPLIVTLTFQIPTAVLGESFLSFIGLGLRPPYSSWGTLAHDAWKSGALRYVEYSYLILTPSLAIFLTMLAFNLLGDGLRDALDPKQR